MPDINKIENINEKRCKQLRQIQDEALELFKKKNKDYGDAFATMGTVGVLVRLQDKLMRAISITNNGVNLVDDEKIEDTLKDMHNYSAMALMLLKE